MIDVDTIRMAWEIVECYDAQFGGRMSHEEVIIICDIIESSYNEVNNN